jgi:hypothetical protein
LGSGARRITSLGSTPVEKIRRRRGEREQQHREREFGVSVWFFGWR